MFELMDKKTCKLQYRQIPAARSFHSLGHQMAYNVIAIDTNYKKKTKKNTTNGTPFPLVQIELNFATCSL